MIYLLTYLLTLV